MAAHHGHRVKPALQAAGRLLRWPQTPAEARLGACAIGNSVTDSGASIP